MHIAMSMNWKYLFISRVASHEWIMSLRIVFVKIETISNIYFQKPKNGEPEGGQMCDPDKMVCFLIVNFLFLYHLGNLNLINLSTDYKFFNCGFTFSYTIGNGGLKI